MYGKVYERNTDCRFPSRTRKSRIEAPPSASIMRPLLLSKLGIPIELAPSTMAGAIGLGVRRGLDKNWSSGSAVLWIRRAMPVFDSPIDIQDRLIAPRRIARLGGKVVPVVFVPARPNHYIDA